MFTSKFFPILVVLALIVATGCRGNAPASSAAPAVVPHDTAPVQTPPTSPPPPSDVKIVDAAPAPGTAQALAQRATQYAQSVKPLAVHRTPTQPSDVPDSPDFMSVPPAKQPAPQKKIETAPAVAADITPKKVAPPAAVEAPHPAQPAIAPAVSDTLAANLEKRARDYPEDLSAQADDQLLRLLREEPVPDVQSLAKLAPEDRELLGALMDSLTNFRNQLRQNNNMLLSQKVAPLVELSDRLRAQGELSVPTFLVCSKAPYFGNYEKIDPARFVATQSHTIGIYYEVENFSSQLNENKMYQTKLSEQIVLYTESSGLPVWSERKETYTDLSHRRRHDFFVAKPIVLPRSLTIGRYLLKVTVEDQQAKRIAENTVPIEIVAQ